MVPVLVPKLALPFVALAMVLCSGVSAGKTCGVICRVRDPLTVGNSDVLKECLYEVYPVESTQNGVGPMFQSNGGHDSRNRLFSLYGGPKSCEYFGNMIQTAKGRDTLVETIRKQLQKSGFKGLDLQCDPSQAHVSQHTYAEFIQQLRSFLGNTYVIMVTIASCQPEPQLIEALNRAVDFVAIDSAVQSSTLTSALMFGLARHRVLLAVPYPTSINCPLNMEHSVGDVLSHVEQHNLFGAVVQLDRDDVNNVCGDGPFPLLRMVLDRLCRNAECNFQGFVRDTRDCGRYYSCEQGYKKPYDCQPGYSFDVCKSSCAPFMHVNCNQTTCTVSGCLPAGQVAIPYPIPFPINGNPNCLCLNNTGGNNGGNNGGGNNNNDTSNSACCCDVLKNLTIAINGTGQFSKLIQLLKDIGVDDTAGVLSDVLQDLKPALNNLVQTVNNLLATLLVGQSAVNSTTNSLNNLQNGSNLLTELIATVSKILNALVGNVLGSGGAPVDLAGGLGGGLAGGLTGNLGGTPLGAGGNLVGGLGGGLGGGLTG